MLDADKQKLGIDFGKKALAKLNKNSKAQG
jgi:hypothetical protein